jgi:cell wall-associated NlpC family hydrolase
MGISRITPILIIALVLVVAGPRPTEASTRSAPANATSLQTAPCYLAAIAALSKRGAIYSQGGALAGDPIQDDGTPYPRTGPDSFDCSGLVWWSYAQAGITIGLTTYQQLNNGVPIPCDLADLNGSATTCWTLGDLIFLRYSTGQHVAIYVGDGLFMDCYNHETGCILHDVSEDSFYHAHFFQARRIVSGCEEMTNDPGDPGTVPPGLDLGPSLEDLPALLDYVTLSLPWQCEDCTLDQQLIEPLPDPEVQWYDLGSWMNWLGTQLWNRVAYPIICWMLSTAQAVLDAVQPFANALIDGINAAWRLGLFGVLYAREMFLAGFGKLADLRLYVWMAYGAALQLQEQFTSWLQIAQELINLAGEALIALVNMLIGAAQALAYFAALFFTLIPALVSAVFNPQTPQQYTEITNFFLFVWFIQTLQAIADSKLGWAWIAFIALFYGRFILWFLEEASELNA